MVFDSTQSVVDDERLRLVTRYFSAAPPPSLPLMAGVTLIAACALILLAFSTTGFWFVLLFASGAFCIYRGSSGLKGYMADRKPTDDKMDEFLKGDLTSIENEVADRLDLNVSPELVVAIDLAYADRTDGVCPPQARIGDDGQLRAERYSVVILFLRARAVVICVCNLDFRTGDAIFGASDTVLYENLELNEDWVNLCQPLVKMIDPVYDNEIPADVSKERVVHVLTSSGRALPIKLGHYSNHRESVRLDVAWPNYIAIRKLVRKLHA